MGPFFSGSMSMAVDFQGGKLGHKILINSNQYQRNDLKPARISSTKISGSSQAGKCPPLAGLL